MNNEIYLKLLEIHRDVNILSTSMVLLDAKASAIEEVITANNIIKGTNLELVKNLVIESRFQDTINTLRSSLDELNSEIERVVTLITEEAQTSEVESDESPEKSIILDDTPVSDEE